MVVLWLTLLLLHQACTLAPLVQVQLGEPATFTCQFTDLSDKKFFWFKQRAGDGLKFIVRRWRSQKLHFGAEFSASRFNLTSHGNTSRLTILKTNQEDEGMYHCAALDWGNLPETTATYLSIRGNPQRTSNYTVVQQPTLSGPERPGDSRTLQCSVLSDSENKTCPGGLSVFWFRAGSDKSHPDIIYTDGNRRDGCEETSEPQRSCVYHFSKSVSSSDVGTYYCAVATCGQILFGDGDKVDTEGTSAWTTALISLLGSALALSLTVIAVLIYAIKKNNDNCNATLGEHKNCGGWRSEQLRILKRHEVYSAVLFTTMKTKSREERDEEAAEKERIYTAVKAFGLDQ